MTDEILKRLRRKRINCFLDGVWIIADCRSRDQVIDILKEFVAAEKVAIVTLSFGIGILLD